MMQEIVRNFRGKNTTIYLVPKGKQTVDRLKLGDKGIRYGGCPPRRRPGQLETCMTNISAM